MRKAKALLLITVSLAAWLACSPRDFLTRRLATDLIAASPVFKTPQTFQLRTGTYSNQEFLTPDIAILQRHGWISASAIPCPASVAPAPCWDVVLTPTGVETVRVAMGTQPSDTTSFTIPTRKRELVAVTGISKQSSGADVEFTWHWIALNEIGAALYPDDTQHTSVVAFRNYDDGWRVVETNSSSQSLQEALKQTSQ